MTVKKNLTSLAKGNKGKAVAKTTVVKKAEEIKKTTDDRDLKVKQKVEELLQDIKLTKEEKVEVKESSEMKRGADWLIEQIDVLTERNAVLEKEAEEARENYKKIYETMQNKPQPTNSNTDAKVLELFDELQTNYVKMGIGPGGRPNFVVNFPAFLNRMIMFFPFLENYKKF